MASDGTVRVKRRQNVWGEGEQLRGEIVSGARRLLEQAGTESAVSMRGVARAVGITAPSIYPHFRDREALVVAVVDAIFEDYRSSQQAALLELPATASPRDRLRAGIHAFIRFSRDHPSSTQVLWTRPHPSAAPDVRLAAEGNHAALKQALAAACPGLDEGELRLRGQLLWAAVYGLAVLPPHHPRFSWCDSDALVEELLDGFLRPPVGKLSRRRDE